MIHTFDHWLISHVFSPAADWLDAWLHLNRYRLAAWLLAAAAGVYIVHPILIYGRYRLWDWIFVPIIVLLWLAPHVGMFLYWSAEAERRPGVMPRVCPCCGEYILPRMTMVILWVASVGADALLRVDALHWIVDQRCALVFCGLYFASCPRPPGRRKTLTDLLPSVSVLEGAA